MLELWWKSGFEPEKKVLWLSIKFPRSRGVLLPSRLTGSGIFLPAGRQVSHLTLICQSLKDSRAAVRVL